MNGTSKTTNAPSPAGRKPYAPPRLSSYGHVKDIVQGNAGNRNDGGPGLSKICWVAEALYGVEDPRTLVLRAWLTAIHRERRPGWLLVELYRRFGLKTADLIRAGRLPRRAFLPVFDRLAVRAFDAAARTVLDERHCRTV